MSGQFNPGAFILKRAIQNLDTDQLVEIMEGIIRGSERDAAAIKDAIQSLSDELGQQRHLINELIPKVNFIVTAIEIKAGELAKKRTRK